MLFPILKDTYTFYWQNLRLFAAILLPLVVPLELFNVLLKVTWVTNPMDLTQQIPYLMASLIVYPVYQTALVLAVASRLDAKTPDVKQLWSKGANLWFVIVLANVMFYLGVVAGLFLFIFPGVYLAIRWSLVEQNIVLNQENPLEALRSSWEDTSDQGWLILGGFVVIALSILIPISPLFNLIGKITNDSPIALLFPTLLQSMTYPLFVIFFMRVRHYIRHNE